MPPEAVVAPGVVERRGGRLVHRVDTPGEGPAVLLLGGCGVPWYLWDDLVARLSGVAVTRLDRPGLVQTPWPGTLPRLAEEVATLVDLVGSLTAPVALVAHSMAGLHAEALVRQHPHLVRALVLVDGSVEWERPTARDALWLGLARAVRSSMSVAPLGRLGPLADRLLTSHQSRQTLLGPRSSSAQGVYRTPDAVASVVAENGAYAGQVQDLAELRTRLPWPGTSVVVLTAAGDGGEQWVGDQRRLAELLGGRQVVVEDSRHLMMVDRADVVADAVRAGRGEGPADD